MEGNAYDGRDSKHELDFIAHSTRSCPLASRPLVHRLNSLIGILWGAAPPFPSLPGATAPAPGLRRFAPKERFNSRSVALTGNAEQREPSEAEHGLYGPAKFASHRSLRLASDGSVAPAYHSIPARTGEAHNAG